MELRKIIIDPCENGAQHTNKRVSAKTTIELTELKFCQISFGESFKIFNFTRRFARRLFTSDVQIWKRRITRQNIRNALWSHLPSPFETYTLRTSLMNTIWEQLVRRAFRANKKKKN